jgi:hypothetical protein
MHLVNIFRIITFSFLVGHSILTISDFNSFRVFWDTLYVDYMQISIQAVAILSPISSTEQYRILSLHIISFITAHIGYHCTLE